MRPALTFRRLTPVVAATMLALCSSVALAEGSDSGESDADGFGCAEMGCHGGSRLCGTIHYIGARFFLQPEFQMYLPTWESHNCYEAMSLQ